ncbi:MAG: hypothetical protein WC781_05685 [Candidatus Pacearchaeota archaeon]|jgi:hypothetical protein
MNKEFNKLVKENEAITKKINEIFKDLKLKETRDDLWDLINALVENELQQEEMSNE